MSTQTIVIIATAIGFLAWYSQASMRNKMRCFFIRPNKTLISKIIPLKSKFVVFDQYKYTINPKRIVLLWNTSGINAFFPNWLPTAIFKWDTDQALDPETFINTWHSGAVMNMAESEEEFKDFAKGAAAQAGQKQGLLAKIFPFIVIGALVVMGFMIYHMSDNLASIGNQISIIRQQLNVK